jgi:hypothetical protein
MFSLHPLFIFTVFPRTSGRFIRSCFNGGPQRSSTPEHPLFNERSNFHARFIIRRCQVEVLYLEIHYRFINVDQSGESTFRDCIRPVRGSDWRYCPAIHPPAMKCWCERREADRGLETHRFELCSHHGNMFFGSDPVNATTWFFSGLSFHHVKRRSPTSRHISGNLWIHTDVERPFALHDYTECGIWSGIE